MQPPFPSRVDFLIERLGSKVAEMGRRRRRRCVFRERERETGGGDTDRDRDRGRGRGRDKNRERERGREGAREHSEATQRSAENFFLFGLLLLWQELLFSHTLQGMVAYL